jgi:hypothetical protein
MKTAYNKVCSQLDQPHQLSALEGKLLTQSEGEVGTQIGKISKRGDENSVQQGLLTA